MEPKKNEETVNTALPQSQVAQDSKNVKTEDSKYDAKERVDFAQTVLFTQYLNVTNGQLKGSFKLSELITKFRFQVDAVSISGIYGLNTIFFSTSKDFYLTADVPFILTAGDKLDIPISIVNNLPKPLTVNLSPSMTAESEFVLASISKT